MCLARPLLRIYHHLKIVVPVDMLWFPGRRSVGDYRLTIFRSPVIACPNGLQLKGEWSQSHFMRFCIYYGRLFVIEIVCAIVLG